MKKQRIILFVAAALLVLSGSAFVVWAGPLEDVVHGESRMKGEEPWSHEVRRETPEEEPGLEEVSSPEELDLLRARIETRSQGARRAGS